MGGDNSTPKEAEEHLTKDNQEAGGDNLASPTPSARKIVNNRMNDMIDNADSFSYMNGRMDSWSRNNHNEENLKFTKRKKRKCCGCC